MQSDQILIDALFTGDKLKGLEALTQKKNKDEYSLSSEIKKTVSELEGIRLYFEYVSEPELVEYAIYREKSIITRLSYLLRLAKEKNIINDEIEI